MKDLHHGNCGHIGCSTVPRCLLPLFLMHTLPVPYWCFASFQRNYLLVIFWVEKSIWNTWKKKEKKEKRKIPRQQHSAISESLNTVLEKNKLFKPCLMHAAHCLHICSILPHFPQRTDYRLSRLMLMWRLLDGSKSRVVASWATGSLQASVLWLRSDLFLYIHLVEHT